MAAESKTDVHHRAPRCLLGLFDVAATGLADCSEFDGRPSSGASYAGAHAPYIAGGQLILLHRLQESVGGGVGVASGGVNLKGGL